MVVTLDNEQATVFQMSFTRSPMKHNFKNMCLDLQSKKQLKSTLEHYWMFAL